MIQETFKIQPHEKGLRIEVFCAKKYPQISRTKWQTNGAFFCEGGKKPGKTKIQEGEIWNVVCPTEEKSSSLHELVPWDFPLKILKESATWVAIEKPEGLSVHPSASEGTHKTIVNALVHRFGKTLSSVASRDGEEGPFRPGIVHRLDKVTSGVLFVAKTNATHRYVQKHWKTVTKTYYALVEEGHGKALPKKGKIEAGITRHHQDRQRMTVSKEEKAKAAETYFETVKTGTFLSGGRGALLKISIPTGRTHQIRVHLRAIGYPILGDVKYGGSVADRVYLHAASLVFPNPDAEEKGAFEEINSFLPDSFSQFLV